MAVSFAEARCLILDNCVSLETEDRPLLDALGQALSQDVVASRDLPLWDNSAMDGYAVRAKDCVSGATLAVTGCILAGGQPEPAIAPDSAARIMTGAPVPPGADAVVPFELAELKGERLSIPGKVCKGDHIRARGEDVGAGQAALASGSVLGPVELGVLAALGQSLVSVHRQARVAILSTGDELVAPGQPLAASQVSDSNSFALGAAVKAVGAVPQLLGIASDDRESLMGSLLKAAGADVLITSAGVSAGERDLVREVLCELGWQELFWKIQLKPGYPTAFGLLNGRPVFSLPGNPVSALMVFEQFVRPALLKMMGHRNILRPLLKAVLKESVRKKPGRLNLLRIRLCQEGQQLVAYSAGDQKSGILSTSLQANAVAMLPMERHEFAAGEEVEVQLLGAFLPEPNDQI